MKICVLVCNSIWYDPRVRKQIIEYKKNGLDVSAIGLKCNRYDENRVAELPVKTSIAQIEERFDGKQKNVFRKIKRERLKTKKIRELILKEKPEIMHVNDLDALMAAYPVCKKINCKIVYDSHEICAENIGMKNRYKFLVPFIKLYEKHMINRIEKMVCVSNAAADYFVRKYKVKRPMVVTNSCLEEDIVINNDAKNEAFEILNHGQFYDGRGYDLMIETAPMLKEYADIKLALRGFGYLEEKLRARVDELGVDNVVFYPKVKVEELIPLAAKSMVGLAITQPICLNFELSVSNKIFEYAAAGLPVIMSNIPEHRYLNDKYNFGIILQEDSPKELAQAIVKLYSDKDFYQKCKENAYKMSKELCWNKQFAQLIDVEREIIKGKNGTSVKQ